MFAPALCSTGSKPLASPRSSFRGSRAAPWLRSDHVAARDQCSDARRGTPRRSSFGSHGGGYHGHPNPLPLSAHSVPGKSCIPPPLMRSISPAVCYGPISQDRILRCRPETIPDLGSDVIVAQCAIGVKMPVDGKPRLPARGPAGSATAAGRPPPALAVAPQPALCEGWPATGTLVRKTSRVDHAAAR